jgi:hypothetical protein
MHSSEEQKCTRYYTALLYRRTALRASLWCEDTLRGTTREAGQGPGGVWGVGSGEWGVG